MDFIKPVIDSTLYYILIIKVKLYLIFYITEKILFFFSNKTKSYKLQKSSVKLSLLNLYARTGCHHNDIIKPAVRLEYAFLFFVFCFFFEKITNSYNVAMNN